MKMRNILIAVSLCFASTVTSAQESRNTNLWKWTNKASHHDSIVKVSLDGATGTGVIIGIDHGQPSGGGYLGQCITASHVVSEDKGRNAIRIVYRNGRVAKNCRILSQDEQLDIALLQVWVPAEMPAATIAQSAANPGDRIELTGLGGGSKLKCCLRHFSAFAADPTNDSRIYANVSLLPGDSGGAVFNDSAELIGIVSGGWFWWHDKRVAKATKVSTQATWPARACNLNGLRSLIAKATEDVDSEDEPSMEPEIRALAESEPIVR